MTMINLLLIFVLNWQPFFFEDQKLKQDYHPPLNIPLILAANFGELRSNHFHMGLDFKTNAKEGYSLHSIDEGYIARVTVSPYGYGRVVYINHPGGITSVYGHCQRLTGKLEEKVKEFQIRTKSSEADLYFQPNELPMKRGEVFALSGNTGASSGPHLHFEVRDTYTEEAINPLKFGFKIEDNRSPNLYNVKIYGLDEYGYLCPKKEKEYSLKGKGGGYTIGNGTVLIPANYAKKRTGDIMGGIGFALNGVDKFDAASNNCGLYGTTLIVDGDTIMHQEIDRVSFSQTRFLNTYTDYSAFHAGRKYHKAFHSETNPLTVYKTKTKGILKIEPGKSYEVKYVAFDFKGNKSVVEFTLKVDEGEANSDASVINNPDYVNPKKGWEQNWDNASVILPENCAFEPFPKKVSFNGASVYVSASSLPVQAAFTVRMKALSDVPKHQQYLAVKRSHGYSALKTSVVGDYLEAESKYFGEINVQVDDAGPYIKSVNISGTVDSRKSSQLVWKMGDYRSGLMNYGLWIDGEWRVLDYESKGDYAFFELKDTTPGRHEMKIVAKDYCGNETTEVFVVVIL